MPWYYSPTSVLKAMTFIQFSHACYIDSEPISDVYNIIKPVFASLNPFRNQGVKFNATSRSKEIKKEKPLHVDVSEQR